MRVLHITSGNLYGGIETVLATLARCRRFCPEMSPEFAVSFAGRLSEELTQAGVPVHALGPVRWRRPWSVWRARRRLAALLAAHSFDAVICHAPWPMAVFGPVVRSRGARLLFWQHGVAGGKHWLERLAARVEPNAVIANSRYTASSTRHIYPSAPVHVVYCPVELDGPDEPDNRAATRREFDTSEGAVVVIHAGRMSPEKGHADLLSALGQLSELPCWTGWIAGGASGAREADYAERIRSLARSLGLERRVRFLGHRTDLRRILQAADLFCLPTTGPEGFGMVFVEALGAGLPVVATKIGAAPEIVSDDSCVLTQPRDPEALAAALRDLMTCPPERLRQRAAERRSLAETISSPAARLNDLSKVISGVV